MYTKEYSTLISYFKHMRLSVKRSFDDTPKTFHQIYFLQNQFFCFVQNNGPI